MSVTLLMILLVTGFSAPPCVPSAVHLGRTKIRYTGYDARGFNVPPPVPPSAYEVDGEMGEYMGSGWPPLRLLAKEHTAGGTLTGMMRAVPAVPHALPLKVVPMRMHDATVKNLDCILTSCAP